MDNNTLIKLICAHYGKRLEQWYAGRGRADGVVRRTEYVRRYREAMDAADFGKQNERFTSYWNCLSGVVAYAMARERGFSMEDGIACYDYMAGPVRKLAAGMWNTADLLPNGFEIVRDNVREDMLGPKGVCWTTEVIEDSEERFEYRCRTCLYYDICCDWGYPEAIQLFCNHDHFAWDGMGRHVRFERYGGVGERRADGSISDGRTSTEPGCLCHDAFIKVG